MGEDIKKRRFVKSHADMARFVIAGIGGGIVGLFNFAIAQPVSVSPLAVAFLVGYAVDVFFTLLQTLVVNFTRRLTTADTLSGVSTRPSSAADIASATTDRILGPPAAPAGPERVSPAGTRGAQGQQGASARRAA